MASQLPTFREPSAVEKIFNRIFGFLVGLGLGFSYNHLLQVRGRKSGKLYSTPIDLLEQNGKRYLGRSAWTHPVGTQCRSHWRGYSEEGQDSPEVSSAGSPVAVFAELTANHPAFELLPF